MKQLEFPSDNLVERHGMLDMCSSLHLQPALAAYNCDVSLSPGCSICHAGAVLGAVTGDITR